MKHNYLFKIYDHEVQDTNIIIPNTHFRAKLTSNLITDLVSLST